MKILGCCTTYNQHERDQAEAQALEQVQVQAQALTPAGPTTRCQSEHHCASVTGFELFVPHWRAEAFIMTFTGTAENLCECVRQ